MSAADPKNAAGKTRAPEAKSPAAKGVAARSSSTGARQGPIDPRTEDPSSPLGLSRAGKTLWRRPGATPRTAKLGAVARPEGPVDFAVSMPLAPTPPDAPVARNVDVVPDLVVAATSVAAAPTVETAASVDAPTELVPTKLVPPAEPAEPTVPVESAILYDQAATIDDVTQIGPVLQSRPLRRPIQFRRAPKPRVRRVTRVVRHVDTWSVFKVAMVFSIFFYAVALVAGVLLWQVAYATGTIDNVEKFFEGFGWETFKFNGGQIYHNAWIAGLFLAVGLTGLAVLMATLFNLITDLVGGIRLSVLEEEVRTRVERGTETVAADVAEPQDEPVPEAVVPVDDIVLADPWAVQPIDATMPVESG